MHKVIRIEEFEATPYPKTSIALNMSGIYRRQGAFRADKSPEHIHENVITPKIKQPLAGHITW
jgi:hypothetical protein